MNKRDSNVEGNKLPSKPLNENRGIGSNPPPKSVSPGPPGSNNPGVKKSNG